MEMGFDQRRSKLDVFFAFDQLFGVGDVMTDS